MHIGYRKTGYKSYLQQGDDVLIVLDVGDAHTHHSRKSIYHDLIVEGVRLVLQSACNMSKTNK